MNIPTVAVLMTSHNRRDGTLECLERLHSQLGVRRDFSFDVTLVDAGSSDGTANAVREHFPEVNIVITSSDVYWGQGMKIAAEAGNSGADYVLWLNDDVRLDSDAVIRLLHCAKNADITVGQLRDRRGRPTYGGLQTLRARPLSFTPIGWSSRPIRCKTFNGNVVLIKRASAELLGPVSGDAFPHAMGDIDYGLRASRAGLRVLQAPGAVGVCERNPCPAFRQSTSALTRLRGLTSVKHMPPRAWWILCRRHAHLLAPAYFIKPYLTEAVFAMRGC